MSKRFEWHSYYKRMVLDTKTNKIIKVIDTLNQQQERIAELEEQLKNAIVPKFKIGENYFAICGVRKKEICPICNGNYRKNINENGFKGEVKCSKCNYGSVYKEEKQIIGFTLDYAEYEADGKVTENNEITINSEINGELTYSNSIYYDDNSDYRSDWKYRISLCQENIFATEEEALAKLEELKGENK